MQGTNNLGDVAPEQKDAQNDKEFATLQAGGYDPTEVMVAKVVPSSNGSHPELDLDPQEVDCGSAVGDRLDAYPGYVREQMDDLLSA